MKPELEQRLVSRYPSLYKDFHGDPRKTCMAFGFECGDGWFDLIDELSRRITEITEDVIASQVKEKFGGLRFYVGGIPTEFFEKIDDLIEEAEKKSYEICEVCGKPGEIRDEGWVSTLCDECNKKD